MKVKFQQKFFDISYNQIKDNNNYKHIKKDGVHIFEPDCMIEASRGRPRFCTAGATALWLAAAKGNAACMEHLLVDGDYVDPQQSDAFGRTPLMIAQEEGHELCVALLSS